MNNEINSKVFSIPEWKTQDISEIYFGNDTGQMRSIKVSDFNEFSALEIMEWLKLSHSKAKEIQELYEQKAYDVLWQLLNLRVDKGEITDLVNGVTLDWELVFEYLDETLPGYNRRLLKDHIKQKKISYEKTIEVIELFFKEFIMPDKIDVPWFISKELSY